MRRHYRSFFWPVVLIVIGAIALLVDLNLISADRLYRLADLWPLILIVIGLELIARRMLQGVAIDIAAVLILLIAGAGSIAYVTAGPAIPGGTHTLTTSDPIGSLTAAALNVQVGAADLTVVGDNALGADLYRAGITYSGAKPDITLDKVTGELRISKPGEFGILGTRHLSIDLHINPSVSWSFSVSSGAINGTFKVTNVRFTSFNANSGAARLDLTVGPPKGMVPISVNGGAPTVHVHRPTSTEVSVQVSGGAVSLTVDGQHEVAIGNTKLQSDGFAGATDAYTIEVNGGACNVTVDTNAPAA
jgi:hypothetical protein